MEASAQPAAPDSHDARESRTGGPMRGTTRAGGGAESAGIDLAWARHQQVMRDKKRNEEEAEKRMLRRMFLVSELQRNWSGGPRVPAKINARESDRQFALHVGRMANIYRKPAELIDMGPPKESPMAKEKEALRDHLSPGWRVKGPNPAKHPKQWAPNFVFDNAMLTPRERSRIANWKGLEPSIPRVIRTPDNVGKWQDQTGASPQQRPATTGSKNSARGNGYRIGSGPRSGFSQGASNNNNNNDPESFGYESRGRTSAPGGQQRPRSASGARSSRSATGPAATSTATAAPPAASGATPGEPTVFASSSDTAAAAAAAAAASSSSASNGSKVQPLVFGAPQRQRPASAGAGRNAVRDVRSERRGSNGSTGGNANGSNGGLSGATTAPAANAQHQVPGQGSNARKPANKAMGVRSKLVGDQVAVYQEFAALLADFDGHDMVQLLEAALSDAQELTGLGDFYATNATPTTTTAAVEETAQGAAQSANAKAIPPVQTGGAQGESAA